MEAEILFNRLNIFDRLTGVYMVLGFLLLGMVFIRIMKPGIRTKAIMTGSSVIVGIAFIAHTFGLGLRWYVSGHAPWSNGYESLIYISWATVLAGFIFARHSSFALSATSIVAGLGLLVAHMSWMDPQITNLVPVLKSYWLTIHVSVISASYGFLGLGALLGFINLVLYIMRKDSRDQVDYAIAEVVRIDEMALMIGVALLSIGNILGAVWANESWGRYWSWDPKETWTLISMMVYAAILHFRFIPALRSIFAFSVGSLLAFGAILMTYFGVNYYLTGMHSYAGGDPVPVPSFLYYSIAVITVVIILAARKRDGILPLKKP
jgi:cytochrome c-type biogenesis protein CcsB